MSVCFVSRSSRTESYCSSRLSRIHLILLCSLGLGLASCSSKPPAPPPPPPVVQPGLPDDEAKELLPPSPDKPQDLPLHGVTATEAAVPAPPPPPPPPPKTFAVWIDSAGFDAFAALGFLQEFEKSGRKPVKIVGTGFGCWVALSWALENSGNRAEWQAMKWVSWDSLPRGLLGKLTTRAHRNFEEETSRLFPKNRFGDLALPVDCPVVSNYALTSSSEISITETLWRQLNVPVLGVTPPAETGPSSGLSGGVPFPHELEALGRDMAAKDPNFGGWIVLRTRTLGERAGETGWSDILARRGEAVLPPAGRMADGKSWIVIDLATNAQRQSSDIMKPEKRREYLLEGRRIGTDYLSKLADHGLFE